MTRERAWERNFPEPAGEREVVRHEIERLKRRARDIRRGLIHLTGLEHAGINVEVRRSMHAGKLRNVEARIFRLSQRSLL